MTNSISWNILVSMRPRQWSKNMLVFAALLFSKHVFDPAYVLKSLCAFALWCAVSGGVYIVNDLFDRKKDTLNPRTARRPVASGALSPRAASAAAAALIVGSLAASVLISVPFAAVMAAYLSLTLSYTLWLRNVVIVDILVVALGFVLRAIAGGVAIGVEVSDWLLICTMLLALFLVISKRRYELTRLGEEKGEFRESLKGYSLNFIDQMVAIVTSTTLVAYAFYTISDVTVNKFHTDKLKFTIPFVLYGIFRYLYIVYHQKLGESPETILIKDRPFLINLSLWVASLLAILYF
ncbi:MAG TPA: decaprenyl-phosphate phosphoribosyltransferase [bacterium]|nr:decaprenyl-phosphate phosphoribosyltransferase [bacterium]